jgi:flagellar motility protein MotE (MotC chaperone)
MPEEEKLAQEETPEEEPKAKPKVPMLLIIIAVGAFVVSIGIFSVLMGVFSSSPTVDSETTPDSLLEQAAETVVADGEEAFDLDQLEREIFGHEDLVDANDLDELVAKVGQLDPHGSSPDSLKTVDWIEAEKAKLAAERTELDALKKRLDSRELQLKQILTQIDAMESSRIGALAKLYDGMKPAQVAPLINKLTDEQAVQVLLQMKPNSAAKILGVLSPDRAAHISANMITLNKEK